MICLLDPREMDFPELTEEEKEVLDSIDIDKVLAKTFSMLPPEKLKPWVVTDNYGNVIQRYETQQEAMDVCVDKNLRAIKMEIQHRYHTFKDNG